MKPLIITTEAQSYRDAAWTFFLYGHSLSALSPDIYTLSRSSSRDSIAATPVEIEVKDSAVKIAEGGSSYVFPIYIVHSDVRGEQVDRYLTRLNHGTYAGFVAGRVGSTLAIGRGSSKAHWRVEGGKGWVRYTPNPFET